uniref:Uncharacterized protein n=1 Tax=Oryza meridionalis TaxID=40149 RepID=A0A0E0C6I7_9ORYZ
MPKKKGQSKISSKHKPHDLGDISTGSNNQFIMTCKGAVVMVDRGDESSVSIVRRSAYRAC